MVTHSRPYWHVDAKWVTGIILLFSFSLFLILFVLWRTTERATAIQISTFVIATAFSPQGLDESKSVEELKAQSAGQPGDVIHPVPTLPAITISKTDLNTLTPRQLRLKTFRQLTEPIYDRGIEGMAATYAKTPQEKEKFTKDAFALGLFTKQAHLAMQGQMLFTGILSLLALAGFIFFSAGWGRLANPGFLLVNVSLPGTLMALVLSNPPPGSGNTVMGFVPIEIAKILGGIMSQVYLPATLLGIGLLAAALIGKIISRRRGTKVD